MQIYNLLNRPMLADDIKSLQRSSWAQKIRLLIHEYQQQGLPAMNGGFNYSNLLEGPDQYITLHPYRLWEYCSLFLNLPSPQQPLRFIDIGGAASPIVYLLAEQGHQGLTVDLQPVLVDVCNYVAQVRKLPLKSILADATTGTLEDRFDFALCISVLEHVPPLERSSLLSSIFNALNPKGFLYLTFDYGHYRDRGTKYHQHQHTSVISESINNITDICVEIEKIGFSILGNDPRILPTHILDMKAAPDARNIMRRRTLNLGPVDGATPWPTIMKYLVKRLTGYSRVHSGRFRQHNFFRLFAIKR